ncbi:DUF5605 domain-containing protein [Alloscardovia criceti]|uniref:DUF5605 domain-containing protein n=1 Tax=Alloscardovia criceti TaxID=356828 RepID=UPI00036DC221|nr:DUF5605 domain-containing protein [Alloscardovia criceti]
MNSQLQKIEQYRPFELNLTGTSEGNPYISVKLSAIFKHEESGQQVIVQGFYRDQGNYSVRFMPTKVGTWTYFAQSSDPQMDGVKGSIEVTPAVDGNHGRVLPASDVLTGDARKAYGPELRYRFVYEDGTAYQPFGTTSYAWISHPAELQEQTLDTLSKAPFNKIRMCIFPKFYDFNHADPWAYAYPGSRLGGFDHSRFNEEFFSNLDVRIAQLDALGIQADIILLHPYDKPDWGFSKMAKAEDEMYLAYMARRYSAYKNVWWSLANEYDLMPQKSLEDWREYARVIMANDAFGHLRSIHNCIPIYDYNEPWCTHCSIQRVDVTRTTECIEDWRKAYGKPVICDEAGYEGNIYWGWGNLTGQELIRRFWEGAMRGGYVTHGETFIYDEESHIQSCSDLGNFAQSQDDTEDVGKNDGHIWWAHGGKLHGESPERIAFMRSIFAEMPADTTPLNAELDVKNAWPIAHPVDGKVAVSPALEKAAQYWDVPVLRSGDDYQLIYFGWYRPKYRNIPLPIGQSYQVDVIDTWNMTTNTMPGIYQNCVRVDLGRQYMAVQIRKVK